MRFMHEVKVLAQEHETEADEQFPLIQSNKSFSDFNTLNNEKFGILN